jgi:hypothetical protein
MNSRERFQQTLQYGTPDRVPYFENEIRRDVIAQWQHQGLDSHPSLTKLFPADEFEEIEPHLYPLPPGYYWPRDRNSLKKLKKHLNFHNPFRLPTNWIKIVKQSSARKHILILNVHHGFFLCLGVDGWARFDRVIDTLREDRDLIREWMQIYGEFTANLADKILSKITVDAALFSEPIGGLNGSLISPVMYRELVLSSYQPLFTILKKHQVAIIIFRTYANARSLIPVVLEAGMNCLWAYETNSREMDYLDLRKEFGRDLRLIGGIDLDALRQGKDAIRREIEYKIPPLVAEGGFIPAADGRIREDVTFENYVFYREILKKYIHI